VQPVLSLARRAGLPPQQAAERLAGFLKQLGADMVCELKVAMDWALAAQQEELLDRLRAREQGGKVGVPLPPPPSLPRPLPRSLSLSLTPSPSLPPLSTPAPCSPPPARAGSATRRRRTAPGSSPTLARSVWPHQAQLLKI
jgi:hypothetical protein